MQVESYTVPFRHWIVEGIDWITADASGSFPDAGWPHWIRYTSQFERKRACEDYEQIPIALRAIIARMEAPWFLQWLATLTGISELRSDPTLRGGGMHVTDPGGSLDIHLDYQIHETLHLERRLNAIVFLNREWDPKWGGAIEFWDATARRKVKEIFPEFGKMVLFECSDESYHGMPVPLACPDGECRKTLAVYYLTPPRGRRRALFVPTRR